jgi:hypothetical protein
MQCKSFVLACIIYVTRNKTTEFGAQIVDRAIRFCKTRGGGGTVGIGRILPNFTPVCGPGDRPCGLVVTVSGCRHRGPGFDFRRYHIFCVAVGLERGKLSLVRIMRSYVRFEVFTAVTVKNVFFWDVTPCGSCKNRRFGGT